MTDLKFKIKAPDGRVAYNDWRIAEAAGVAARLAWANRGAVVLVETYQGDVQVWIEEGVLRVVPSNMLDEPEWSGEFERLARRTE